MPKKITHPDQLWRNVALELFQKNKEMQTKREEFLKKFKNDDEYEYDTEPVS